MAKACLFSPLDKNKKPYKALPEYKKALGAETGTKAFLKALSPKFQQRHEGKLDIDEQGVATLDSAIQIPEMKKLVGFENVRQLMEKDYGFTEIPNTADNFRLLVNQAKTFNDVNPDYVAYPEKTENGIRNVVHQRNAVSVKAFNDRYGSMILNDRLLEIFEPLGLSADDLLEAENGYSGIVDFSNAKAVAGQFVNLIRISNGMEGQMSMSEEFSHLIVRMLRDQPLIQRILNDMQNNEGRMQQILGDDYDLYLENERDEDGYVNYEAIAEECVGRLLQESLLNNTLKQEEDSFFRKMWQRLVKFIKNTFSNFDHNEVSQAALEADQTIDTLAKNLLAGNLEISQKSIERTFSDDRMHHLEENVDVLQKIVEDAIDVETKKTRIIKQDKAVERAEKKAKNLQAVLKSSPEGKLKGIINYAKAAVTDLGYAREALGKINAEDKSFSVLRGIRSTIQSYDDFIRQLSELINSNDGELKKLIAETKIEGKDHVETALKQVYDELASLHNLIKDRFKNTALDSIEAFFAPFFNVEGGKFIDRTGKEKTLRQLIEEADGDIGFTDRYLQTMSVSGDLLLQMFDDVVKKAKADARYNTISDLHDIIKLMLDAEEKGITSFDWMYEKDSQGRKTGNYISAVNIGQFERDKQEFLKQLEEDYGINPTGEKAKEKKAKKKEWLSKNGRMYGTKPNPDVYRNTEFDRLSSDQKEILNEFMRLKQKYDKRLPSSKTTASRAIQMRRTSQQRLLNSLSDPSKAFKNIQESIAKELTKSEDDDAIYGQKTGLRSFDGSEFKILPALYTTRLSNPDELTTDVFSALAAYSYSTNVYTEMDKVVDPLEVARAWIADPKNRRVAENRNGNQLVEKVKDKLNPIFKNGASNIIAKLDDFMDSQVYMRYYADSDKTIKVMGRELKAGKLANKWMSLSSTVQLGFNALAHLANATTGACMQNIEAFCGQYFNAKELAKADAAYLAELKDFLPQCEAKNPTNKLALFDQLFDIKQEFAGNVKNQMNTLFEKLFGKSVAFLGQTCGDHWLYNRTAIAMCMRKKVKTRNGEIISLWDDLHTENAFKNDDRIKKLVIDAVDADTGEEIDREYIRRFSGKINEINHRLFGVYNSDDMVAAQRVALGRAVLQYRQWIVPMFTRRFGERRYVTALEEYEEGYYRSTLHLLAGLKNGYNGVMEVWEDMDEGQRRNCFRALTEVLQFLSVAALANFCSFGKDDPDRIWALKLAEYMAQREKHELGNLTPSFTMGREILKTIKSPASILNTTQATMNLIESALWPWDWFDETQSGKYEGMSTLHKNFLKAPIPILAPFNQMERLIDNIEETTLFYARD